MPEPQVASGPRGNAGAKIDGERGPRPEARQRIPQGRAQRTAPGSRAVGTPVHPSPGQGPFSFPDRDPPKVSKLAAIMDDAETDVLAYMTFPEEHRTKLHSTNPIERLNGEIKRRTDVVGIFPNDDAIVRLVGALLLEQNDEWAVQRARYMTLETIGQMSDDPLVSLPAVAR